MSNSVPPPHAEGAEPAKPSKLAHDLRGPISVIRAHARMLMEGMKGALGEDQRRSILAIERQANRLVRLVNELDKGEPSSVVEPGTLSGIFASASLASPPFSSPTTTRRFWRFWASSSAGATA